MIKKIIFGTSLIEILVVITIFSVLGILSTRAVLLALKGARKSEASFRVRENLNYALGVVERQIRNAGSISSCTAQTVNYLDENGTVTLFSCINPGPTGYIASGSARLTGSDVAITSCAFSCSLGSTSLAPSVTVSVTASDATNIGAESAQISSSTQIFLRGF